MKRAIHGVLFCLAILFSNTVGANDSAIIVFDGSGSMWAKVDDKPKIAIARDVMGSLLEDWDQDIDLGLMVYGHREKGNCDDIEMLIPVGKSDPAELLGAIKGITPKGETPIGASLQLAAEKLNYIESTTTVILISDGEESCNADPCAVAKELNELGTDFVAHVIGFDVSGEKKIKAKQQLKCVAESTGGTYFEAENASSLKKALSDTAKVIAQPVAVPQPKEDIKQGETGIRLQAVSADGVEPFTEYGDVSYKVYSAKKNMDGEREDVDYANSAQPTFELEAGKYLVAAERGNAREETILEVNTGEITEHTFILNSGNLHLLSIAADGVEPFTEHGDVSYKVYSAQKNVDGKREDVDYANSAQPTFELKAGKYLVVAERGNVRVEMVAEIEAGKMLERTINLNTGNLKLSARSADRDTPFSEYGDVKYIVYSGKSSMDAERIEVDSSSAPQSLFKLKAGDYTAVVEHNSIREDATIEVKAGKLIEHEFVISGTADGVGSEIIHDNLSGEEGASLYFSFDVPKEATSMILTLNSATGDADLFVKHGSRPSRNDKDKSSFGRGEELIKVTNPQPGTHHILVLGDTSFENATLVIRVD